jgi:hypothetical protein
MRRLAAHWLLALALVVAQHGVYAHALSHLDEDLHGHDGGAKVDHGRDVCAAFGAASGGAVGSCELAPHAAAPPDHLVGPAPADPLLPSLALTRFASRAPPPAS